MNRLLIIALLLLTCMSLHAADATIAATATAAAPAPSTMNGTIADLDLGLFHLKVTGWKLVGWLGGAGFLLRWIVQAVYRKRTGTAEIPTAFWIISLVSAAFLLSYFIFGKNDSVGIMSNLFPMFIASYNLHLDLAQRRNPPVKKTDGPNT